MKFKYIHRNIEKNIRQAVKEFPVIIITGPRQTGKTTLTENLFPDYQYVTLDNLLDRSLAKKDPELFLENYHFPIIIDEIQYVPELLSYIKIIVDKNKNKNGLFILSGSQMFQLMQGITESLAGRAGLFELLGFSWDELPNQSKPSLQNCFNQIFEGFYPRIVTQKLNKQKFYQSYIQTYIERDIRNIQAVHDIVQFQTFLELVAARTGSILNLNEIGKKCSISQPTARKWLSLLETTRIVYLLRPYHKNISKRIIKSPKIYFSDTGILAYILRYSNADILLNGPMAGDFFENMIVGELLKNKFNSNESLQLYFYRDSNHNEIDLIIELNQQTIAVEIKMGKTLKPSQFKFLNNIDKIIPECNDKYIISFMEKHIKITPKIKNVPWWDWQKIL